MSERVVVADYGIGNLLSVQRALEHCGADVERTDCPERLANADRLVVPGVGAFGNCIGELRRRNLVEAISSFARTGRPYLGICVGMQMMLESSEEFGRHEGLGLIAGRVVAIPPRAGDGQPHKIPFIGWAPLRRPENADWSNTILATVKPGEATYFVHSFAAVPAVEGTELAYYEYDSHRITAAIRSGSLFGCQFHPEKSGPVGLRILTQFLAT